VNLAVKELIVVLLISIGVFKLAQPIAQLYCPNKDFARRCKVWIALTVTIFIAPNFWVFVFVATPILIILGKRDSNPAAAFLFLLFVLPSISVRVPMIGLSFLIQLDFPLLLTICLLSPTAWRLWKHRNASRTPGLKILEILLLAYCVLTAFVFLQPEVAPGVLMQPTFTDCLRRTFEIFFGLFIPYFVISRTSTNRAAIQDMIASFSIKCALLAAVATFEYARSWLLYGELVSRWGLGSIGYISRGGDVRAMASAGHPLLLGYLLAVAFGFWLYLQQNVQSRVSRLSITGLFLFGLMAAYSRGPWLGAIVIYFSFAALGPRVLPKMFKAIGGILLLAAAVAVSPLGAKIARVIPYFGGAVDMDNVVYRERLFALSWQIIMDHPWFGDQQALLKMQELRQGEGIIDLMNGFVSILLSSGFVGLSLFLLFIAIASFKAFRVSANSAKSDPDLSKLGACLVACILGSLVMMWVGGLIEMMTCVLVGLTAAYVDVGRRLAFGHQRGGPAPVSLKTAI
jgi:O-antigen ligase